MKSIKMLMMVAFTILSIATYSQEKTSSKDTTNNKPVYSCPMHSSIVNSKPVKCPKCGMSLKENKQENNKIHKH